MTTLEEIARTICETKNVDGFKCTCPLAGEPAGNSWCNGDRALHQARAVLEKHVGPVIFMAVLEGKKTNKNDGAKEAFEHAEKYTAAILAQLTKQNERAG